MARITLKEVRDAIVSRILSGEITRKEAAEQYDAKARTISYWLWLARRQGNISSGSTQTAPAMKNFPLPKGVSFVRMIEARGICRYHGFDSAEAGAYYRKTGLMLNEVKAFNDWMGEREVVDSKELAQTKAQLQNTTKELNETQKDSSVRTML